MLANLVIYVNNHLIQKLTATHTPHYSILTIINKVNITEAICQLLQKDLIITERSIDCFDLIKLHQMDFIKVDGMFKHFNFETGLVP